MKRFHKMIHISSVASASETFWGDNCLFTIPDDALAIAFWHVDMPNFEFFFRHSSSLCQYCFTYYSRILQLSCSISSFQHSIIVFEKISVDFSRPFFFSEGGLHEKTLKSSMADFNTLHDVSPIDIILSTETSSSRLSTKGKMLPRCFITRPPTLRHIYLLTKHIFRS